MSPPATTALDLVRQLAAEIGPRRPTSVTERSAAELVNSHLRGAGLDPHLEPFRGISTFAWPNALPLALAALRPGPAALALALAESELRLGALTRLMSTRPSANVVAAIEPQGPAERTLCLVSHLDSSRSGLLFHAALAPHLRTLLSASSAALAVQAAAPVLRRSRPGRAALGLARGMAALGLGLLAERELRGEDVPGANDNASGVAVAATVAVELAASPPRTTRIVFLATGCEESGTVGMRSFLEANDTSGWLFLNLDGVGAPATLRYLPREGVGRIYGADPALISVCEGLARNRPELGLKPAERLVGLTYDATQVLARGGRAITLSAQDDTIPNYHTPTDTPANIDPDVLDRAERIVRELVAAIDRGGAD